MAANWKDAMKIDYLGYIVEPAAALSESENGWRANVIIWRQGATKSLSFDAFGVHANEASAKNAALMYAQNLILGHLNDLTYQLAGLDEDLAEGLSGATAKDAAALHRYDGTHLADVLKPRGDSLS